MVADIPGARLRSIIDGAAFDSSIELNGVAIGGVTIEARFNGGDWATVATAASGAWNGTLSGQTNGIGRIEIRTNGVLQDWRDEVQVGTVFTQVSAQALWAAEGAQTWAGRPHVIDRGDGTWIACYRSASGHGDDATSQIVIRFSSDEGATWTAVSKFTDNTDLAGDYPFTRHNAGAGDSVAACILIPCPNGDIIAQVNERPKGIYQFRSTDGGKTWGDEGRINDDATLIGADDYEIIGTDIYICIRYEATPNAHPHRARVYKSDDNGATWTKVGNDLDTVDCNELAIFNPSGNKVVIVARGEPNDATGWIWVTSDITVGTPTWTRNLLISRIMLKCHRPRAYASSHGYIVFGREYAANAEKGLIMLWDDSANTFRKRANFGNTVVDGHYVSFIERNDGSLYGLGYEGTTLDADVWEYVLEVA